MKVQCAVFFALLRQSMRQSSGCVQIQVVRGWEVVLRTGAYGRDQCESDPTGAIANGAMRFKVTFCFPIPGAPSFRNQPIWRD